jgi:hypothetical protein
MRGKMGEDRRKRGANRREERGGREGEESVRSVRAVPLRTYGDTESGGKMDEHTDERNDPSPK